MLHLRDPSFVDPDTLKAGHQSRPSTASPCSRDRRHEVERAAGVLAALAQGVDSRRIDLHSEQIFTVIAEPGSQPRRDGRHHLARQGGSKPVSGSDIASTAGRARVGCFAAQETATERAQTAPPDLWLEAPMQSLQLRQLVSLLRGENEAMTRCTDDRLDRQLPRAHLHQLAGEVSVATVQAIAHPLDQDQHALGETTLLFPWVQPRHTSPEQLELSRAAARTTTFLTPWCCEDHSTLGGDRSMRATVIATTRSGSRYVILIDHDGVQWTRLPAGARADPMVGWLPSPPRIVQGQRLMLGSLQSTPVTRVSFLPGPEPPSRAASSHSSEHAADEQQHRLPEPWNVRSLFGGNRH